MRKVNASNRRLTALVCGTIAAVLWGGTPAYAAEADAQKGGEALESYTLDEVIVTAQRVDTKDLDTPAIVEVYDEKKIEETGAANAFDILKNTLGVTIHSQGFNGTSMGTMNSKIMIRGVERGTLILLNGVPWNLDGRYNLDDIPAESIERIEVVKGGGSVLYGSEATGGVINIITKDTFKNKVSVSAGNYGKERYTASFGVDRFNIVLGLENRGAASPMSDTAGKNYWYDYGKGERKSVLWNLKLMDGLTFTHSYSKNENQYLKKILPGKKDTPQTNEYEDNDNTFFLNYDKDGWKATLSYGTQEKETEQISDKGVRSRSAWRKGRNIFANVQKQFTIGPNGRDKFLVGLNYQNEDMDLFAKAYDSTFKRNTYSLYLSYDWQMNERSNLLVNLRQTWATGINVEQKIKATGVTNSEGHDSMSKFTPELEYMHHFNDRSMVYAKVGQSFRMPSLSQLYDLNATKPIEAFNGLKPEKGNHYEIGYKLNVGKASLRAALFHFDITDAIEGERNPIDGEPPIYHNSDIRNTGIELSASIKHDDNWTTSWGVMFHNPQQRDFETYADNDWHNYHGKMQFKANVNYKYKKFTGALDMNYVGDRTTQNADELPIRPQFFTDLHLTYSPETHHKFFFHLNNIFDRRDITSNSNSVYYTLGRNFMAGYEFTF